MPLVAGQFPGMIVGYTVIVHNSLHPSPETTRAAVVHSQQHYHHDGWHFCTNILELPAISKSDQTLWRSCPVSYGCKWRLRKYDGKVWLASAPASRQDVLAGNVNTVEKPLFVAFGIF